MPTLQSPGEPERAGEARRADSASLLKEVGGNSLRGLLEIFKDPSGHLGDIQPSQPQPQGGTSTRTRPQVDIGAYFDQ